MVEPMEASGLPCFRGGAGIPHLHDRCMQALASRSGGTLFFGPERAAAIEALSVIFSCAGNYRTRLYDLIQWYQNSIPFSS